MAVRSGLIHVAEQVSGLVTAPYNALLANGGNAVSVGSIDATADRASLYPTAVEINGKPCGLVVSSYKGAPFGGGSLVRGLVL